MPVSDLDVKSGEHPHLFMRQAFLHSKNQISYRMLLSLFISFPRLTNTPVKTPIRTLKIFSHRGCYGWAEQNKIGLLISLLFCI